PSRLFIRTGRGSISALDSSAGSSTEETGALSKSLCATFLAANGPQPFPCEAVKPRLALLSTRLGLEEFDRHEHSRLRLSGAGSGGLPHLRLTNGERVATLFGRRSVNLA